MPGFSDSSDGESESLERASKRPRLAEDINHWQLYRSLAELQDEARLLGVEQACRLQKRLIAQGHGT